MVEALLTGVRALDLTDEKGHLCGKILADLGADVVKVEPPGGDPSRNIGPFYKDIPHPENSLFWWWTNLNKRAITLSLEAIDGKEIFRKLVHSVDLVIESFEPGYMDDLELGYQELEKINPGIIMTSITPFGQSGPYAHYKSTDLVGVSMGGMVRFIGELDRPPNRISAPQFHFLGGINGAVGSMVAYYHRELTGEGQYVDVSCQEAVAATTMIPVINWDIYKFNLRGIGPGTVQARPAPLGPLFSQIVYPCKDGHVLFFLGGGSQLGMVRSSTAMVQLANEEGMALELKDEDWSKVDYGTIEQEEINRKQKAVGDYLLTKTKAELLRAAVERQILLIPVNTVKDLVESPQFEARDFWVEVEHPELGERFLYPGFPIKWTGFPPYQPQRRAPLIGEHNEEIYIGELGLSKNDLVLLKSHGII